MPDENEVPFRGRLDRRARTWWEERTSGVHGPKRCHELRLAMDPEALWKCCPYWQRKLSNKWNAREFAVRHGVRVPGLYWSGQDVDAIPFDELPDDYVIRLTSGHSSEQVCVLRGGVDLLTGTPHDRAQVRERFAMLLAAAFSRTLMLVEEYIPPFNTDEPSGLPVNYRFHMFGDVLAWISTSCAKRNYGHFSPDWRPVPWKVARDGRPPHPWPRPVGLDRMLEAARTLGRAFESYVRVDLYDAVGGPFFAEFAPHPGQGRLYTDESNLVLERLWTENFPDAL